MNADASVLRPHSGDTSYSLLHSRRRPRDIQVHDNLGILKIHSLAQQVRR
jgi:hypothetical protein